MHSSSSNVRVRAARHRAMFMCLSFRVNVCDAVSGECGEKLETLLEERGSTAQLERDGRERVNQCCFASVAFPFFLT